MAITYNAWGANLYSINQVDGGTWGANQAASIAFDYFPDDAAVDDALYFGGKTTSTASRNYAFHNLKLYVGTAFVANSVTFVWEYWNGSAWTALSNVVDNTNGFTVLGENTVTFDRPEDWVRTSLNGLILFWIRCRISAIDTPTEGGAQSTQTVEAGDNTIVVTGGTEGSPIDFDDIYSADVAGGWGVFKKDVSQMYRCYASLDIGDGLTTTYVTQKKSTLNLFGILTLKGAATFQLGELVDGLGVNGCCLNIYTATINSYVFYQAGGTFKAYGSMLLTASGRGQFNFTFGTLVWYDTILAGHLAVDFRNTHTLVRGSLSTDYLNIGIRGTSVLFDSVVCYPRVRTTNASLTLRGLVVDNYYISGNVSANLTETLINPDVNSYTYNRWSGGLNYHTYVNVDFDFDLKVVDNNGNGIEGATVTIHDVEGTEVFSGNTDGDGSITSQVLRKELRDKPPGSDEEVVTPKTPHTVTISKSGYKTRVIKYTMDRKREEVEKLELQVPIFIGRGKALVNTNPADPQNMVLA